MAFLPEFRPFGPAGMSRPGSLFDELIRDTFRDYLAPMGSGEVGQLMRFQPRVNVTETNEAYELECEVPGIAPEEVKVTLSGDTLTIQGEKRREEKREGDTWHVTERSYGSFQRSFTFPANVDADSVEASSENGVLHIKVMKATEQQPKRIQIRSGGQRELRTTGTEVGAGAPAANVQGKQKAQGGEEHKAGESGGRRKGS